MATLTPARLGRRTCCGSAACGLRTRPLRAFLSALGIAIGIAAMIAVVGISSSSPGRAGPDARRARHQPAHRRAGQHPVRRRTRNCRTSRSAMIARIGPVTEVSATGQVVRRHGLPHRPDPGGARPAASRTQAARAGPARHRRGARGQRHLAQRGHRPLPGGRARRGRRRSGSGSPRPARTAAGLAGRALVHRGRHPRSRSRSRRSSTPRRWSAGRRRPTYLGFDGHPTTVYTRSAEERRSRRSGRCSARPPTRRRPNEVEVSRPSDALAAQQATDEAFTGLLLGLGAVALLVGGVGVANTMVISVLERRAEIGLRRSLGRHPGTGPDPVPRRVAAAVRARRGRRGGARHRW